MYNKLPRVIRDYLRQSGQIIVCNNWFKLIQFNKWLNMENIEEDSKNNLKFNGISREWYFHNIELYNCYNTFAVISQIKNMIGKESRILTEIRPEEEKKEVEWMDYQGIIDELATIIKIVAPLALTLRVNAMGCKIYIIGYVRRL